MNKETEIPLNPDFSAALTLTIAFSPQQPTHVAGNDHWLVKAVSGPGIVGAYPMASNCLNDALWVARMAATDWLKKFSFDVELPTPDYSAPAFLEKGAQHMRDRAEQRDAADGERSMAKTVAAFNALYGKDLSEEEGWMFMVCLKQARASCGIFVPDDYEDGAAYFGLAGEAAASERKPK